MAKQLKPIEGHIAQINAPRFAEDQNMWVMMVKENGKWPSVTLPRTLADIGGGKHDFHFLMLGKVRDISGDKVICLPAFGRVPLQGIFQIGKVFPQHLVHFLISERGNFENLAQI